MATYQDNKAIATTSAKGDPLGNELVASSRELSGAEKKRKRPRKPKKAPPLSRGKMRTRARGRGRGGTTRGRGGRGGKTTIKIKKAIAKEREGGSEVVKTKQTHTRN